MAVLQFSILLQTKTSVVELPLLQSENRNGALIPRLVVFDFHLLLGQNQ